ncbi:hypothetical protein pdam_00022152, partial [Pocillopora damicornis]
LSQILYLFTDKPEIATHPHNIRTREGQNVTLYCNATGNPALTISWYKNEYPISNDSRIILSPGHEQLTIRNVNRKDSGNYTCRANNSVGTDTSNASTINVQYLDKPDIYSTDMRPAEGTAVKISCIVDGQPTPTVSWTMNGSPLNTSGNSRIFLRNGDKQLNIMNLSRTDSGEYRCVAQNSRGNISSNASVLSVQHQPEIALNPLNATKVEGENITWSCNATGNPEPIISWIFCGSNINTTYNPRIVFSKGRQEMTITSIIRTDNGEYQCMASNMLGNVSSRVATLDVLYQPEIVLHPLNATKVEGENITWSCNATGNPEPNISWIFYGSHIKTTYNPRIAFSKGRQKMTITSIIRMDSGEYQCMATNMLGNVSSRVATLDLPLITIHPERKTPMQGEKITLSCNATGNPEPSISWVKDGSPINSNSRINFSQGNKRLTITNISRTDSGKYRCVARNRVGNDTLNSRVDVLSNADAVYFSVEPEVTIDGDHEQYVAQGSDIRLICRYDAFPPVSEVQWIKNGTAISGNTSRLISDSRVTISSFNKPEIVTHPHNITTGKVVPDPPQNITVDTKGSRVINISWTAGFDGNCAIKNYTVKISQHDQILKDVVCQGSLSSSACVVSSLSTTASLTGLLPWTTYNIRVFARNKIGRSSSSPILNVTTDEEVPSKAPNFVVTVLNSTAVNVSWQMLSKDIARGAVLGYYVLHRLNSTPPWINKTVDRAELTSLLVGPLNEHTSYEFAMQAFNSKGASHLSASSLVSRHN